MCVLTARHGRGTAWARHAMCESAFKVFSTFRTCRLHFRRVWRKNYWHNLARYSFAPFSVPQSTNTRLFTSRTHDTHWTDQVPLSRVLATLKALSWTAIWNPSVATSRLKKKSHYFCDRPRTDVRCLEPPLNLVSFLFFCPGDQLQNTVHGVCFGPHF